jgi:histidyl-tRNA synthetase
MSEKLSNMPYKGCTDYFPEDFQKLQYIFEKWRTVAEKYAYEEYLTPVLERAEIYEAKSGEDVKKELYTLMDKGERRLSLRPEMTPSVTRMITRIYGKEVKPIRYFSIANFFRGETPQKGRGREFWQFNADMFGEENILADLECVLMAIDIMLVFNPPKDAFTLKLNNRKLINFLFANILEVKDKELIAEITRKMDKYNKLSREEFEVELKNLGLLEEQIRDIVVWMTFSFDQLEPKFPEIGENQGYQEIKFLLQALKKFGYGEYVIYAADLIRGFDYYDGTIFEVFDMNPSYKRSLFGGGRYNGLANLFGSQEIPAVGFAAGDMSVSVFLDNWNLWPNFKENKEVYFLPILQDESLEKVYELAKSLRFEGRIVEMSTEVMSISKALGYANKKQIAKVIIYGTEEMKFKWYKVKDMVSGKETTQDFNLEPSTFS